MPTYKLHYLDARGRAEIVRWMFKVSGTKFDDVRYTMEEWAKKKNGFPFRQLPVLEVTDDNGKTTVIPQSGAIVRYLGREFGYCGANNLEMARAEFLYDHLFDVFMKLYIKEADENKKKVLIKQALEGPVMEGLKLLEGYVLDCGYFVGKKVTIADLGFGCACESLEKVDPTLLDKLPKLKALAAKVRSLPEVQAWMKVRPKTEM